MMDLLQTGEMVAQATLRPPAAGRRASEGTRRLLAPLRIRATAGRPAAVVRAACSVAGRRGSPGRHD